MGPTLRPYYDRVCSECSTPFYTTKKHRQQCSEQCRVRWWRKLGRMGSNASGSWPRKKRATEVAP